MSIAQEAGALKGQLEEIVARLNALVGTAAEDGRPVHELEREVWRQVLQLGRHCLRQFFALAGDGDLGEVVHTDDGHEWQRLEDHHVRRYVSIFGTFRLERVVYGSREGQKIEFVPLDNRLQLPAGAYSYVLQDWAQGLCVESAFGPVSATLERMLELALSVDSLERMNERLSERVEAYRLDRPQPAAAAEGELMVASADGKGVVMRRPAPARPQPQHKHVMASLARRDEGGDHSGIEVVHEWLMNELVERNRHQQRWLRPMVFLYDGQEALWDARAAQLPSAGVDILDLLHVTPRLWKAAHVFHPEGSDAAEAFVRERCLRVLQGQVAGVIRGLREMATKRGLTGAKKRAVTEVCAYLEKNRGRMRYDDYLAAGYPIASGVIEGACRHLVKDRMERAGMHWTPPGAQAMLDVRSMHVDGEWDNYQTYRIERETRTLYPYRHLVAGTQYALAG
jgi:hypothetical protein